MKKTIILLLTASLLNLTANAQFGSLSKWFNKEVVPTIKGERPLRIDPTRVRISQNGKDILRASTEGNGSLYVDLGVARVQTNDLRKEILRTTAVLSGNTAVMSQVAFDQFKQVHGNLLKKAIEDEGVKVLNNIVPPEESPEVTSGSRKVIIYNNTDQPLSYALNKKFYTLAPDQAYQHASVDDNFYLEFDDDPTENGRIARYFLTGSTYSLYFRQSDTNIGIYKIN